MTMMITKFHKLIGSKIFWTAFIILVVASFVLMYAPQVEQSGLFDKNAIAGMIDGKKVTHRDFELVRRELRALSDTDESEEEFDQRVWFAIAAQKKAKDLGVTISDKEVDENIRMFFTNRQTGQFDPRGYDQFIANQFGPGKHDLFERLLRDRLLEERVRMLAANNFLIAPSEIKQLYHTVNDEYTVEYALLDRAMVEDSVEVTEEQLKAYFDDNSEAYMLPEKVKVAFLRVPVTNYYDVATVTTNDITTYYEQNITSYSSTNKVFITDTNEVPLAQEQGPALTEATNRINAVLSALVNGEELPDYRSFTNEIVFTPMEEVSEEITQELAWTFAQKSANAYAEGLYAAMLPRRGKAGRTMISVAEEEKLESFTTDYFTFTNEIANVEEIATFTFARTAFGLETNLADRVSTPILGSNYVYVLYLDGKIAPALPTFEEVRGEVSEAAQTYHVGQALFNRAAEIRGALSKAMSSNTNFTHVASNYNLTVEAAAPFVLQTADPRFTDPITRVLMENVRNYEQGDVTEVLNAGADVLIGYIKQRKTADATDYATVSQEIRRQLQSIRLPAVAEDYDTFLKNQLGVESQLKYEIEEDDEEES